jgi:hypothetical protein
LKEALSKLISRRELKLAWLTDDIAICGAAAEPDWKRVLRQGVTAVLDVRDEAPGEIPTLTRHGIAYQQFSLGQNSAPSIATLERAAEWVRLELNSGEKVLIHSDAGAQGSAVFGTATLVALGFPIDIAYSFLYRAMPDVTLSVGQTHALEVFAAYRSRRRSA